MTSHTLVGNYGRVPPKPRAKKTINRQRLILDKVIASGSCTAQELATEFDVSIMTIHRDLDELERRGAVRKFHGGVTAQPSAVFESQMSYRMHANDAEKTSIAEAALAHIEPGMSIMLDDSTTVLKMIPGLVELAPLHVATTCMAALRQLADLNEHDGLRIIGLGGDYDAAHDSFVGIRCVEQIEAMRADALFMSTSAVSGGIAFHQEDRIVSVKRAMIRACTKRYLLVDNSKFNKVALHRLSALKDFDLVITDSRVGPDVLSELDSLGVPHEVV